MELANALTALVILAFFIERALATVFDWKLISQWLSDSKAKVPIAILTSFAVVVLLKFDILKAFADSEFAKAAGVSGLPEDAWLVSYAITALILAGGSAAALKLMQDVLGISKVNRDLVRQAQKTELEARVARAEGEKAQAEAVQRKAQTDMAISANMERASHIDVAAREVSAANGADTPTSAGISLRDAENMIRLRRAIAMGPELKAAVARSLEKARIMKLEHAAGRPAS
jgi:hypothetical protein